MWLWDNANNVWVPAPAAVVSERITATGLVIAGEHKLFWISMNPSAANSVLEITDATAPAGVMKLDAYHATRDHMHMMLMPPMQFDQGIYVETLTSYTSVIFGYI